MAGALVLLVARAEVRAVVAGIDNHGVVGEAQRRELPAHAAEVRVEA